MEYPTCPSKIELLRRHIPLLQPKIPVFLSDPMIILPGWRVAQNKEIDFVSRFG